MESQELQNLKILMIDIYRRYRTGEINQSQAKVESDLLIAIIKSTELTELKEEITKLKNLLTK